jgi:hypothetical protein
MDPTDSDEAAYMRFEPTLTPARRWALALRETCDAANVRLIDMWLESDKEAQYHRHLLTVELAAMHERIDRERLAWLQGDPSDVEF